jgi:hypothetical protein
MSNEGNLLKNNFFNNKINENFVFNNNNNLDDNDKEIVNHNFDDNNNENNDVMNINNSNKECYFKESKYNSSIFRESFNYYLSYFYEQDFSIPEEEEPKNANFFARLFKDYPKIYDIMPELKTERNFIIFLRRNTLSDDEEMFKKIFEQILNFIQNNLSEIHLDEDKIIKNRNPENLLKKSYNLLKEKRLSYTNMNKGKNNKSNELFEEFNINGIPILMAIQMLFIIEKYPDFIEEFAKLFPDDKEIVLAFSFYLSSISYDRLLSGRLNLYFNKGKNVLDVYNDFYLGLFGLSLDLFNSKKNNYYEIFLELESEPKKFPSSIFWKTKLFKSKYFEVKNESSLSSYFNNSSVNQK